MSAGGLLDALVILAVVYVVIWSLHPSLLVSSSLITGGDTGSHLALPAYLRTQGNLFDLTPWYPGWFAGMPAYTYYFVLPDYLAVLGSYVISFAVAFKLATVLGSVLMPVGAYVMARLFRAPRPVPAALAVATLPFLFDASFTIDGGNLFSTMAGEYAFALSLAVALVAIGLFARGVRTGRGYWWAAIALSVTLASHVLPWLFAIGAVGVLVVLELAGFASRGDDERAATPGDRARPLRFAVGAGLLSAGLSAWWLLPFATTQSLTNSMGYVNDNVSSPHAIFTTLGWFNATGGVGGDRWVIALAAVALVVAVVVRDRLGVFLAVVTALSFVAYVADPQSVIWNERLVPFWFISIHLIAGWLVGYAALRWSRRAPRAAPWQRRVLDGDQLSDLTTSPGVDPTGGAALGAAPAVAASGESASSESTSGASTDAPAYEVWVRPVTTRDSSGVASRRALIATVAVAIAGLLSTVPGLVSPVASALGLSTSGNQVTAWAQWNYSGYQGKAAWPEYHDLITTMARVARRDGCGRAMWEYSASENRFGTPEALMLLPYWTNNCVDSMEGLFFESSPTTPYHFLDQAELSSVPSEAQVGLPYGPLDVTEGVQHLQMLGVRYYIAFSPLAVAEANSDPQLRFVAQTRAWPSPGVRWRIYLVRHSAMVTPLRSLPNVVANVGGRTTWLAANVTWWMDPKDWPVLIAGAGPASWPRVASVADLHPTPALPAVVVTHVVTGTQSISFHVSRVGVPVLVKISYYPRWHATGATGPYRASPNLMVVVPTSHQVSLTYASTPALTAGNVISDVTTLAALVTLGLWWRRRRRAAAEDHGAL
ncbi:MAG: hypothetical protein ACP5PB_06365 [Acidimicrobiales bacterium]